MAVAGHNQRGYLLAGFTGALSVDVGEDRKGFLMNFVPGPPHTSDEGLVRDFVLNGYPRDEVRFSEGSLPSLVERLLAEYVEPQT